MIWWLLVVILEASTHWKPFSTLSLIPIWGCLGISWDYEYEIIFSCQRKYVLKLPSETRKLGAKSCSIPMVPNIQLMKAFELFDDPLQYRRLFDDPTQNYPRMTCSDIAYPVSVVGRWVYLYMLSHHWKALSRFCAIQIRHLDVCSMVMVKRRSNASQLLIRHGQKKIEDLLQDIVSFLVVI